MDGFFNPKGIVIFGLSASPRNLARIIIHNLKTHNYQGKVVGIGSKEDTTLGVQIYKSIHDVKAPIDLAVIVTPSATVVPILKECRKFGINRAVIISGGFKELKGSKDQLSDELIKTAEENGIRFVGPNCQGVINTHTGVCLPFGAMPAEMLKKGDFSIISQSGTVAWLSSFFISHEISGVNKVISIGNKMNVDEVDMMEYLLHDETTRAIILHLESTERGRDLFELLSHGRKPTILLKTQVSLESASISYSHTAALADDDRIVEGTCLQAGVMRATTFREMIEMAKAISLPAIRGNRLAILSSSGGIGIMAADACKREGMKLASIPDKCLNEISELPKAKVIKVTHPVDTGNIYDNRVNFEIIKMLMNVDGVDGGVFSLFTGTFLEEYPAVDELVNNIAELSRTIEKPIALHFLCDPLIKEKIKTQTQFPLFDTVEEAVEALGYLWRYEDLKQKAERWRESLGSATLDPFKFSNLISSDLEGFRLVSQYEIPCENPVTASDEREIILKAEKMGYPLALKALSPDFTHKLVHGAVALNIKDEKELREAAQGMMKRFKMNQTTLDTFLLQRMVPAGPELIFGGKRDPHYGPVILLGLGGTGVEENEKVICYMAPISEGMAEDMLTALGGIGQKGNPHHEPLKRALTRFSQLLVDNPHIDEIDLNPVRLLPEDASITVLDVRVRCSDKA